MLVGAAVAYLVSILRPVVSSVRSVNELTPFPVLGVVGVAFPTKRSIENKRHIRRFSAATAGLFAVLVVVLILNHAGARLTLQAIRTLVNS